MCFVSTLHMLWFLSLLQLFSHIIVAVKIFCCVYFHFGCVFLDSFFFFHLLVFPYITVHLTSHWHHTLEPAYEIESICRELLLATPFRGRHRGSSAMSPYPSILLCQFNPVIFHYIYECSL